MESRCQHPSGLEPQSHLELECQYALSLKQPWAALVVHGLKTIEVRRWPTTRRGRILIHASRVPDTRAQAWQRLPKHLEHEAQRHGGIVGAVDLVGCIVYRDLDDFLRDQPRHLNEAEWFSSGLYGFTFTSAQVLQFQRCSGWMRFFPVLPAAAVAPRKFARRPAAANRKRQA